MRVTLNIQDDRLESFLKHIENLEYAQIIEKNPTSEQQEEILKRMEAVRSGKMKSRSWEEAKRDIFKR